MKTLGRWVLCAMLAVPGMAMADPGFLDFHYVAKSDLDIEITGLGSGSDDGNGFGARLLMPVSPTFALTGEYQANSYDDSGLDVTNLRFGGGLVGPTTSGLILEYVSIDLDDSTADGFSIKGRLASARVGSTQVYGEIGYVTVTDDDDVDYKGVEFNVGAAFALSPVTGLILDYRKTNLDGDDLELTFSDFRVGLRMVLGA